MENLDPPTPNQGWENGAFCPSRGFILDLGGGDGGLLFHFILSKIVAREVLDADAGMLCSYNYYHIFTSPT